MKEVAIRFCFISLQETFLAEQTSILSQCYEEKRRLAAEKAEFVSNQRKAIEKEQRNAERHFTVTGQCRYWNLA